MDRKKLALGLAIGTGVVAGGIAAYFRVKRHGSLFGGLGDAIRDRISVPAPPPLISTTRIGDAELNFYQAPNIPIDQRVSLIQKRVWKGITDPRMRKLALELTNGCPRNDGACEAQRIFEAVKKRIRYTGDVAPVVHPDGHVDAIDYFQGPWRTWDMKGGDCLPVSTLVLRDDYTLVPLISLDPGDRIMADGQWTMVQERWLTGVKPLLAFDLSNGCVLRCSPDHRVFRDVAGRVEEVLAGDVKLGDDLITPESVPVAGRTGMEWPEVVAQLSDEDLAWLVGVYVADGWVDGKVNRDGHRNVYRSAISGRDGHPKEEQKRRIEKMLDGIVNTRWHQKYIALNDSSLARFFGEFGHRAPEKHLTSLEFARREEVAALLDGLAADADRRDGVFGTTSPQLALQLRVLHRMVGQSVHIRRVDEHGGLGEHPIYRITPRSVDSERRDVRFARVRAIREAGEELCADLTTDAGKFWLPESDTIVHNCDDFVALTATLASVIGVPVQLRVTAASKLGEFSHVYPVLGLPKTGPRKWVALDNTLVRPQFGREVPYAKKKDYAA